MPKCQHKRKTYKNYSLFETDTQAERVAYTARCTSCGALTVKIKHISKIDGKIYRKTYEKKEAERINCIIKREIESPFKGIKHRKNDIAKGFLYLNGDDCTIRRLGNDYRVEKLENCFKLSVEPIENTTLSSLTS